jgi:ribosomal protein S18 acetylase RimI-like enzyme
VEQDWVMEREALDIHEARPEEHLELYQTFADIVARGEGFPQDPAVGLTYEEFNDYWLDHKSYVGVATLGGRLAGSYHLKPNFVGRAAHIANAGYFVVRGLRGQGIGERLVRHSMERASALGFDALQFNAVFASNPARRLYERLGFQVIGSIPHAIRARGRRAPSGDDESIVIYWRSLP